MRRNWYWLLLAGLLGYVALDTVIMSGALITVPRERDLRLVGRWKGVWTGLGVPSRRTLVLFPDGSWAQRGNAAKSEPLKGDRGAIWGTEAGRLHVKWMATDAWVGKTVGYSISDDGQVLRLVKVDRLPFGFPAVLRREEEGRPPGASSASLGS